MDDSALITRWRALRQNIAALAEQYPAAESRRLLAVSKYTDSASMRVLYEAGQRDFAESYWQAAAKKMLELENCAITWHYIGALQSNKCAEIASHFHWVHSLSTAKHALLLARARENLTPLQICLQVNLSQDSRRQGVLPAQLKTLVETVLSLPTLNLRGLMVLPTGSNHNHFAQLAALRDMLEARYQISLPTLSMGMSDDYPQAIAAGATIVRIGSALFGPKNL